MFHPGSHATPARRTLAVLVLAVTSLAGCAATPGASVAFDPAGACTSDGRQPGAYPELEAKLPTAYEGAKPTSVDSGRNCTAQGLGTLTDAGIGEVRFAGASWDLGSGRGLTVATFTAAGLDATKMLAFYEAGARTSGKSDKLATSDTTVVGRPARRLDVLATSGAAQTIVAWPSADPDRVNVLLAADLGDAKVAEALEAFGHQ